jgi:hypothetical protein
LGSGKKSWIPPPSFRSLSPDCFVGLFVFFLLLTNLKIFAFFRNLCYYTALFFWRGERAPFFFFLLLTLTTVPLLRLVFFLFSLLLNWAAICLFLSLSVTTTIQPSREKIGWEDSTSHCREGYRMECQGFWFIRVYSCECERCMWDMWLVYNYGCRFCLDFTSPYFTSLSSCLGSST